MTFFLQIWLFRKFTRKINIDDAELDITKFDFYKTEKKSFSGGLNLLLISGQLQTLPDFRSKQTIIFILSQDSKIKILRQMKMCSQVARLIFLLQVNRIQNFTSNETFLIKNLLKSQVVPRVVLGMENGMA